MYLVLGIRNQVENIEIAASGETVVADSFNQYRTLFISRLQLLKRTINSALRV